MTAIEIRAMETLCGSLPKIAKAMTRIADAVERIEGRLAKGEGIPDGEAPCRLADEADRMVSAAFGGDDEEVMY